MENLLLKFILPFIAITVSIISLYISSRNTRRNIRVAKVEEMLEISFLIQVVYRPTFILVQDIVHFRDEIANGKVYTHLMDQIKINTQTHKDSYETRKVFEKLTRLKVISNAYLSNTGNDNLKMKIHLLIDLIFDMNQVIENQGDYIHDYIRKGLPKSKKASKLFESIDTALIKEMGLGYNNMNWNKYSEYRKTQRELLIEKVV